MENQTARNALSEIIQQFEGKEVAFTVEERTYKRSDKQNRYYWSVISQAMHLMNEAGNNFIQSEVHDFFKAEFLRKEVHIGGGALIEQVRSTKDLTPAEMSEYTNRIRQWMIEYFGFVMPDPEKIEIS